MTSRSPNPSSSRSGASGTTGAGKAATRAPRVKAAQAGPDFLSADELAVFLQESLRVSQQRGAAKTARPGPSFLREHRALTDGTWPVAGCDEAGRGPMAGPVVAAAVILDPQRIPCGLDDSKKLTASRRDVLFERICASADVAVALAPPARIDRDNILRASLWALAVAVRGLTTRPRLVLVDGRDRIDVACDCEPVIGGDGLSLSIAAASIVAKVTRDRLMVRLGRAYPGYGFEQHMGYCVPQHRDALRRLGPTPHHRHSFAPVSAFADLTADDDRATALAPSSY